jgi:hypothetical protein
MIVSACKAGTYGIRIWKDDRVLFNKLNKVHLLLEGRPGSIIVNVSTSFKKEIGPCSELRSAEIGKWLKIHGKAPWHDRKNPKMEMVQMSDNVFKVCFLK